MSEHVTAVEVLFSICIDGQNDCRYVRAQANGNEPMEIGWYEPLGEAFAVFGGSEGQRIDICADDTRALMTLVKEFAQAVLDTPDMEDGDDDA